MNTCRYLEKISATDFEQSASLGNSPTGHNVETWTCRLTVSEHTIWNVSSLFLTQWQLQIIGAATITCMLLWIGTRKIQLRSCGPMKRMSTYVFVLLPKLNKHVETEKIHPSCHWVDWHLVAEKSTVGKISELKIFLWRKVGFHPVWEWKSKKSESFLEVTLTWMVTDGSNGYNVFSVHDSDGYQGFLYMKDSKQSALDVYVNSSPASQTGIYQQMEEDGLKYYNNPWL